MKNSIFEVDIMGLRQLQSSKPKWFIIRELIQNAIDEDIKNCVIYLSYERGKANITVEDDSPIGFRDLADAYTLFKDTYKRNDVTKRGRFNFGEKQVLCLADSASIISTTGGVEFDILKGIRITTRRKRELGSQVHVVVRMTRDEYEECKTYCHQILVPKHVNITINADGVENGLNWKQPLKTFNAKLLTEVKRDGIMKCVSLETKVNIHKASVDQAYIYELGIPICQIDCDYSIDVQQKVPMSNDRDKVDGKYLKDLYALVLNEMVDEIDENNVSQTWVRTAFDSNKIDPNTVKEVQTVRFGDKAVIHNPFDPNANDEAISKGYKVIHHSEMNDNERKAMKQWGGLVSSTALFGKTPMNVTYLTPKPQHVIIANLAKKIAKDFLRLDIKVNFFKERKINAVATYGNNVLSFNLAHCSDSLFHPNELGIVKKDMLNLLTHEIAHSKGNHTDHSYHECITKLAAEYTHMAIINPEYFKII